MMGREGRRTGRELGGEGDVRERKREDIKQKMDERKRGISKNKEKRRKREK